MKHLRKLLCAFVFGIALAALPAFSQPFPGETWIIDENGPALLTGFVTGFSNGRLQTDPISGLTGLYFPLAGAPNQLGDLLLLEPVTFQTNDLLRFDGTGGVYFFSDLESNDPNPDRADVPQIPRVVQPNSLTVIEVGPEGNNGLLYVPLPGQPGYDTSGLLPGISYNIISDVPEPGSLALLLSGAAIWGLRMLRRKNHA